MPKHEAGGNQVAGMKKRSRVRRRRELWLRLRIVTDRSVTDARGTSSSVTLPRGYSEQGRRRRMQQAEGKRRRAGGAGEAAEAEADGERSHKTRRSLHAIRRVEISELKSRLESLEVAMRGLQRRAVAVIDRGDAACDLQAAFARRVLRANVQRQQVEAAPTLRLLSEYSLFNVQSGSPVHEFARLPKDPAGRRTALIELRDAVLGRADGFLRSRLGWVDPRVMVRNHVSYESPDGDYCLSHVSSVQFDGRATVRGVFKAVHLFLQNIEIVLSESLGSVTIREDDQHAVDSVSQSRLVSFTPVRNLVIESNSAVFSRFDDDEEEDEDQRVAGEAGSTVQKRLHKGYGIAVLDFVDEDELFPYQSERRARRDANAIFEVAAYMRPKRRTAPSPDANSSTCEGSDDEGVQEQEEVVTLIHWVNMRLHRPSFALPDGGWQELRHISERWVNSLQFALHEIYVP